MGFSWKKTVLITGVTAGGGVLAVTAIGIAAPIIGTVLGVALGFSGAATVDSVRHSLLGNVSQKNNEQNQPSEQQ